MAAVTISINDCARQFRVDAAQRREAIRAEDTFSLSMLAMADPTNRIRKNRLAEALEVRRTSHTFFLYICVLFHFYNLF